MKIKSTLLPLLISSMAFAQIPNGYYDGTNNLTGYQLKTKLHQIISGHRDLGYNGLWETYKTADIDKHYENDGTIMDIYSEKPSGKDPYTFRIGRDQCGTYRNEGDCYNREHIIPQSLFNKKSPMRNDAHFVVPTDGKVNGLRGTYPFGEVSKPKETTKNGSKIGNNTTKGYSGVVFEPIDEFKGDVARMILYFATRYQDQIPRFDTGDMFNGTKDQSLAKWQLDVLLKWHNQDPVSQREIDRNNAVYSRQNNRNPYIDHPEFANIVWNYTPLSTKDIATSNTKISIAPNPVKDNKIFISNIKEGELVKIFNTSGRLVQQGKAGEKGLLHLQNLPKGVYWVSVHSQNIKLIIQ